MKLHALFTVIALLLFTICAKAQVRGKVIDAATGDPIANASVRLSGSSKGATSNRQGEFVLYTDETKVPLVVSYIGYQSETIDNYNGKTLTVKLSPRDVVLREVVIGNTNREEYMKVFLKQFIGKTNAKDCFIQNPDDINFRYNKKAKVLKANASDPLIIINKKLGYKITYTLSAFSYSKRKKETSYKGDYVFEEDTLGQKPDQMKKILEARDKAYYGSRMHFMCLVWAQNVEKSKFWYAYNNLDYGTHYNLVFNNVRANKEKLLNNTFSTTLINGIHHFLGSPCMIIKYNDGYESHLSFQGGTQDVPLTPVSYNNSDLIWSGKMAEQRVSELLPFDFVPSEPL